MLSVEGGRPGGARRLGVGYDEVKKLNPAVVYCSVSGYGQDGPYAQVPGHNVNYIGYAGVLSTVGLSFFTDMTHLEVRLFTELTHPIFQVIDPSHCSSN